MSSNDINEYRKFTGPAELHKAVNTLKGIVSGLTTDAKVSDSEMIELVNWCSLHEHLRAKHPFNELLPLVDEACKDLVITDEEAKDIIWLCNSFVSDADYYDFMTSSIQFLSGMLHGIMADGELSDSEIHSLQMWVDHNEYLQGCYPFDEIASLLTSVLADGKIDNDERNMLKAFFSQFIDLKASANLHETEMEELRNHYSVSGICAACPEIDFQGRSFCFTGQSYKGTRKELEQVILNAGGLCKGSVSKKTDYVIVGNAGNPCWAYACYGRKIEEAVTLRKEGAKVMIINETDFWDAVEDLACVR